MGKFFKFREIAMNKINRFSLVAFAAAIFALPVFSQDESSEADVEEVIVTGYGSQSEREITSATVNVNAEDFNQGPINDPVQLLQGKVAGLSIYKPGGNPNESPTIRIRGLSTLGANTAPLVVIDGVPGATLASIDANDIESMTVLKDGSGAAIYGTRGSSGVILITSKKGRSGPMQVNYSTSFAQSSIAQQNRN